MRMRRIRLFQGKCLGIGLQKGYTPESTLANACDRPFMLFGAFLPIPPLRLTVVPSGPRGST